MDLATLDTKRMADAGAELQLHDPVTGKPLGVYITLHGMDSDVFRDTQIENLRNRAAIMAEEKRTTRTAAEIEADAIALHAACTKAWRGAVLDGAALECTRDNARTLYQRFPWIREQVDRFIGARGNFLPSSASNS